MEKFVPEQPPEPPTLTETDILVRQLPSKMFEFRRFIFILPCL